MRLNLLSSFFVVAMSHGANNNIILMVLKCMEVKMIISFLFLRAKIKE